MRIFTSGVLMNSEARVRLLCGFEDLQTSQMHPITGTPTEVPVPRKVRYASSEGIIEKEY
jgi:hypothetical protein